MTQFFDIEAQVKEALLPSFNPAGRPRVIKRPDTPVSLVNKVDF